MHISITNFKILIILQEEVDLAVKHIDISIKNPVKSECIVVSNQ